MVSVQCNMSRCIIILPSIIFQFQSNSMLRIRVHFRH